MTARWWWIGYGIAALIVIGTLTWFTVTVNSAAVLERRAQRAAFADETARLALWRMDSQLATMIAREAGRPHLTYNAFYPAAGALDRAYDNIKSGEVIVPSPLLGLDQEGVLLHVQVTSDGTMTSPQVPAESLRPAVVPSLCSAEQLNRYSTRLHDFARWVTPEQLSQALDACDGGPRGSGTSIAFACATNLWGTSRSSKEQVARTQNYQSSAAQSSLPVNRQQDLQTVDYAQVVNDAAKINGLPLTELPPQQKIEADIMRPLWFASASGDLLLLVRRVQAGSRMWMQACWLDWPALRIQLLASIRDLLPDADVVPTHSDGQWPHRLATLPLALRPGASLPDWQDPPADGVNLPLLGAWAGVVAALIAGALLLGGALALSERRGAFVSAVTHELRTPLTTFRLYTDLLAEGRVDDPQERQRCLDTLRGEAERLGHLVENVLGYARLERAAMPTTALGISALVEGMQGRLLERAQRANLALTIDLAPDVRALAVRGEAQAIERILVNLVDNACKYAASALDRRLHLELVRQGRLVAFRVRDHGPGIATDLRRRLFTPFAKSAAEAATTAPGIGLGLALSRRLAQQLGGDLRSEVPPDGGAAFVLELPIA